MPQSAFDLSANQAAAVLSLLERAEVPPFPVYYGLLFDYVAGTPSLVGSRIGSILDDGKGEAAERLYSEFVAPYENREPLERAIDSMVSGGAIISGATVRESLLFTNVRVDEGSLIERSLIFPDTRIGAHCVVKNAIVDTAGSVPAGTQIGVNKEEDARRFYITEKGVVLVTRDMLAKLKT